MKIKTDIKNLEKIDKLLTSINDTFKTEFSDGELLDMFNVDNDMEIVDKISYEYKKGDIINSFPYSIEWEQRGKTVVKNIFIKSMTYKDIEKIKKYGYNPSPMFAMFGTVEKYHYKIFETRLKLHTRLFKIMETITHEVVDTTNDEGNYIVIHKASFESLKDYLIWVLQEFPEDYNKKETKEIKTLLKDIRKEYNELTT